MVGGGGDDILAYDEKAAWGKKPPTFRTTALWLSEVSAEFRLRNSYVCTLFFLYATSKGDGCLQSDVKSWQRPNWCAPVDLPCKKWVQDTICVRKPSLSGEKFLLARPALQISSLWKRRKNKTYINYNQTPFACLRGVKCWWHHISRPYIIRGTDDSPSTWPRCLRFLKKIPGTHFLS